VRKKLAGMVSILTFCVMIAAQEPTVDIDKKVHPNLAAAQQHIVEANRYITTAQKDNRYDMKDHAEKATQLLMQADHELKAAAEAANAAGKKK
jgi:hypothetical protein